MKKKPSEIVASVILHIIMVFLGLVTLYPFWHVIMYSLSDSRAAMGGGLFWGLFLATVTVVTLSEILSRMLKSPVILFLVPMLIPLVPGGSLYQTMFYIVQSDYTLAVSKGVETVLIAGCIALAIALVTAFSRPARRKEES